MFYNLFSTEYVNMIIHIKHVLFPTPLHTFSKSA